MNTIRIRKADFTIGEAISHGEFEYTIDGIEHLFAITGGAPHAYRITHMGTGSLFVKMPDGCGDLIDRAMLCVELVVARYGEKRVAAGIARAPVLPLMHPAPAMQTDSGRITT